MKVGGKRCSKVSKTVQCFLLMHHTPLATLSSPCRVVSLRDEEGGESFCSVTLLDPPTTSTIPLLNWSSESHSRSCSGL